MVVSTFITNKASSHRQMDAAGVDGHVGTLPTLNMNKTPVRANKADRRNTGEPRETGFSAGQVPLTQNVEADSKSRYANHGSHPHSIDAISGPDSRLHALAMPYAASSLTE